MYNAYLLLNDQIYLPWLYICCLGINGNLKNSPCFGEIWDVGQWSLWTSSTYCWVLQPPGIARGKDIYAEKYFFVLKRG